VKHRETRIEFSDLPLFGGHGAATVANDPATYGSRRSAALDVCGERHGGNPESEDAFQRLSDSGELEGQEACVLSLVTQAGDYGITLKEAAVKMKTHPNNISGRFTALHLKHEIRRKTAPDGSTVRRGGAAGWILNRH
jgi:hypothetical protein